MNANIVANFSHGILSEDRKGKDKIIIQFTISQANEKLPYGVHKIRFGFKKRDNIKVNLLDKNDYIKVKNWAFNLIVKNLDKIGSK